MSKLDELIQKLCPNGVEKQKIKNVVLSIHSGLNPRKNFVLNTGGELFYVTVKEITSGKIVFSDKTDKIDEDSWTKIQSRSHLEKGDVLLSSIGTIGKVAVVEIDVKNWNCSESVLLLKPNKLIITSRYLKYCLESSEIQNYFNGTAVGSTLKGIRIRDLEELEIPVPPIEVQDEIVRILDNFTELTAELIAELTAELTARRKQYEYYRDTLFELNYKKVKLKDICLSIKDGMHNLPKTVSDGCYPILSAQNINDGIVNFDAKRFVGERVFAIENKRTNVQIGDVLLTIVATIGRSAVVRDDKKFLLQRSVCVLKPSEKLDPYFLRFYLDTSSMQSYMIANAHGSAQAGLYLNQVADIEIPLPPLNEQKQIVEKLKRFDSLSFGIKEGLTEEIECQKQQYEYYRDKLLSFKELK